MLRTFVHNRVRFSSIFYEMWLSYLIRLFKRCVIILIIEGLIAAFGLRLIIRGGGDPAMETWAAAIFLTFLWVYYRIFQEALVCVQIRPYFEWKLGTYGGDGLRIPDTYLYGFHLLRHSRELDILAEKHGVEPISHFASGDDMIGGTVTWFEPQRGLRTVAILLRSKDAMSFSPSLKFDLERLRDALELACSRDIRFALILNITNGSSPIVEAKRIGSFI